MLTVAYAVKIDVHFYSIAKELAETASPSMRAAKQLVIPERSTLEEALEILFREMPMLARIRSSCLYAVGTNYAPMNTVLSDGDQVSMIPPMQGG